MRNYVSFQASFPEFTTPGEHPGYEISLFLQQCLTAEGIDATHPETLEGYTYDMDCMMNEGIVNISLTHVGDHLREWLLIVQIPGRLQSILANQSYLLNRIVVVIDWALKHDLRFQNVRWYTADIWDNHPNDQWTSSP